MNDETHSPDGLIRVEWAVNQGRMSHEIWSPCVSLASTGEVLFDLRDGDMDGSFTWLEEGRFRLSLRRYSRTGHLTVWVDVPARTIRIGREDAPAEPLATAQSRIAKAFPWPE